MTDTYPMPADGWVCFHCGERFTTPNAARDHFGHYPTPTPACRITAAKLREELREYRALSARFGPLTERNRTIYARSALNDRPSNGGPGVCGSAAG